MAKTKQLQIRVTEAEKAALQRLARAAGMSVSGYMLSHVLPAEEARLNEVLRALRGDDVPRFALAELSDLLTGLAPAQWSSVLDDLDVSRLSPWLQNYVAAMVEQVAQHKGVDPPAWTRQVETPAEPYFAAPFARLRPYLLRAAPVAFKRRNLFVDSGPGDRV